ncbi:MAG: amphi-Trp domain-containing protein [Calditrichaeota bacterium]|nr:amphi-Trp domain-containing protein [Candidatus Cloacimonadota bacterium]MCA9786747.1 amphi-Trp domain-containing protein [Candidatus Cloacimonadota bacterium]MCB1046138.1 amphi-Trp domain-containing protein [Calditrichota bacterium]MCB9473022.1 amphi-Trp domain-containing protein [Candidatus Delongbacteria bacterium]
MEKGREFEHRSLQDGNSIGGYLRALADGFERGELTFKGNGSSLTLNPGSLLEFTLRVESVGDHRRLVLTTEWSERSTTPAPDDLRIGQ